MRVGRAHDEVDVGGHTIRFTNIDKILFPEDALAKGDLILYYHRVARFLLPYLAERPLTLQRWPDGIDGMSFFEKEAPRGTPPWVKTIRIESPGSKRGEVRYVLCNDEATLLWLANLATITFHVWTSRAGSLDQPDYVLFDLDPQDGCRLATLARVAVAVRGALEELGLKSLVKTSGGTGLHVMVPIAATHGYDDAKLLAELVARRVAKERDDVALARAVRSRPHGSVYIDYVQVGKGKTIVPPFTARARPGAPVSMPIAWRAVEAMVRSATPETTAAMRKFTIRNVPDLLDAHGDPWTRAWKPQRIDRAMARAAKGA